MTAVCVLVLYHIRFYCRPEGEIFNKSTTLEIKRERDEKVLH